MKSANPLSTRPRLLASLLLFLVVLAPLLASAQPHKHNATHDVHEDDTDDDGDCEMHWVTVTLPGAGGGSGAAAAAATTLGAQPSVFAAAAAAAAATAGSSNGGSDSGSGTSGSSTSGGSTSSNGTAQTTGDDLSSSSNSTTSGSGTGQLSSTSTSGTSTSNGLGEAGFPLDGTHLSAPVASDTVPAGAATYTPKATLIDGQDFANWANNLHDTGLASKWLVIKPGTYQIDETNCITFGFFTGGWTFDFRGTTFYLNVPLDDKTSGQAIYIDQSEDLTVLGGTVWFDAGELWSQAKATAVTDTGGGNSEITLVVDEGYYLDVWKTANAQNLYNMDTSNPNHYTRPTNNNYWYFSNWDFSALESDRTIKVQQLTANGNFKVGEYLTMIDPRSGMKTAIASEYNGGLHVKGLTTNAALAQYGIGNSGKVPGIFEDCWLVNPPARPGFAPRVQGPTLSFGHIDGFNFVAQDGEGNPTYPSSQWQYTGCSKDLTAMSSGTLPTS